MLSKAILEFGETQSFHKNKYAWECIKDSLCRNEAPFSQYLFYPQFLTNINPEHRKISRNIQYCWGDVADYYVCYVDHGISNDMHTSINRARTFNKPIKYRRIKANRSGVFFILLSGKRSAGKDTVAEILKTKLETKGIEVEIRGFANIIKAECANYYKLDYHRLLSDYAYKTEHRVLLRKWAEQKFAEHSNLYCVTKLLDIYNKRDMPNWKIVIIPDNRFQYEINYFKDYRRTDSIFIRVNSSEESRLKRGWEFVETIDNNTFETDLDNYPGFDISLDNNSSIEDLKKNIYENVVKIIIGED